MNAVKEKPLVRVRENCRLVQGNRGTNGFRSGAAGDESDGVRPEQRGMKLVLRNKLGGNAETSVPSDWGGFFIVMNVFGSGDFLVPKMQELNKWAVIACDQFTSDARYWQQVERLVGDAPSALRLTLPEIYLTGDYSGRIRDINVTMQRYLQDGIFKEYSNSYIYVERTLLNGAIRRGVVGLVDLENYSVDLNTQTAIRPTERTVLERIPPRKKIREGASLELSHILLLCDDAEDLLLGYLEANKAQLPLLYDFDLMQGGGRLRGYLVQGAWCEKFTAQVAQYEEQRRTKGDNLLYAVGDGNHSLCTAKACYEAEKENGGQNLLSRYAMVELENIQDASQQFEPIHRIVTDVDVGALVKEVTKVPGINPSVSYAASWDKPDCLGDNPLDCLLPQKGSPDSSRGIVVKVESVDKSVLAVGVLQEFLDDYLARRGGKIDYIHDDAQLVALSQGSNSVGFLLPPIDKNAFFHSIVVKGVLPRKTFSMGHGQEKRYYLECRKIKN